MKVKVKIEFDSFRKFSFLTLFKHQIKHCLVVGGVFLEYNKELLLDLFWGAIFSVSTISDCTPFVSKKMTYYIRQSLIQAIHISLPICTCTIFFNADNSPQSTTCFLYGTLSVQNTNLFLRPGMRHTWRLMRTFGLYYAWSSDMANVRFGRLLYQ